MLYGVVCYGIIYIGDEFMRVSLMKCGEDKLVYIVDSCRVDGKVITKVVEKLGRLSDLEIKYDDPIAYAKGRALSLTNEKKKTEDNFDVKFFTQRELQDSQTSFNIGYLFLQKVYYGLSLDKICKEITNSTKVKYDLNNILKDLIFSRILYPSSKLSTYDLSKNYVEQPNYNLHDVYRSLDLLSKNIDFIQKEVYKNSSKICKRNTSILYYDCTNYFFEIEKEDGFRNYGISKEHRPSPIVQMGLFMDGNGIPLAFNINPGNTNEQVTPIPTEEMIEKEFGLSKFIYCSDAGLGSYNNKWFNQLKNRSFIVTQSLKKLKGYLLDWALDNSNWDNNKTIEDASLDEILYKSRPIKEKGTVLIEGVNVQKEINQRLIVTYSPKYAAYQKQIRNEQIERAKKLISKPSAFDKYSSTDFKRLIKNIAYDKNGEVINKELYLDTELIEKEAKFDGYYSLVTNLEGSVEEIVKINHNRWEIEESFRIMKTDFKARPVYLQNKDRITSHFLTCYLALLIYRILEQKINTNEKKYSNTQIINALKNINLFKLDDIGYASNYKTSDILISLCESFGLDLNKQAYRATKIKKLIKQSKN